MAFKNIIGHDRPIRILKTALQRRRLAHAYLFHGEEGIGKKLAATALAKTANCLSPRLEAGQQTGQEACDTCQSCRNIESETHPDLMVLRPEGTMIKIGQIRRIQEQMHLKPIAGQYRFIIIDEAETMKDEAANALLKSLEEPPDLTILVLITSQLHAMLGTVVSRCQRIRFSPISDQHILALLQQRHPGSPTQLGRVAALAMGRIGLALELDPTELETEWQRFSRILSASLSPQMDGLLDLAQDYAQDRQTTEKALQWIGLWLRDLLAFKLGSTASCMIATIPSSPDAKDLARISARIGVEDIVTSAGLVHWIWKSLSRNLNRQLALEVLLMHIQYAARPQK